MARTTIIAGLCSAFAFVAGLSVGLGLGVPSDPPLAPPRPLLGNPAANAGQPYADPPTHPVLRVVDGDTFTITYRDEGATKVRLLGIDTPERGEPGYAEATAALRELIGTRPVTLHFDAPTRRDNFGRLLARVTVDGVDVGAVLLERGLAKEWRGTERPVR